MPASAPHPDPLPCGGRGQRGQAIVLVVVILAVVVGMAALAVDGSRAFALRRDTQAAVDAAALAAADKLQQTGSYISAEQAASTIFGTDLRLYSAPSCNYGPPGGLPITCTYSDGTVLTEVVSSLGPQGSRFDLTATRQMQLGFARILSDNPGPTIIGSASGGVDNLLFSPTLAALSSAGCGGAPGAAITTTSGGTLNVIGDMVANGAISIAGSAQVAGDVYARC